MATVTISCTEESDRDVSALMGAVTRGDWDAFVAALRLIVAEVGEDHLAGVLASLGNDILDSPWQG